MSSRCGEWVRCLVRRELYDELLQDAPDDVLTYDWVGKSPEPEEEDEA